MKKIAQYLNEMKERGIIKEYALGGATALVYYFEPIQTQDIDIFVFLRANDSQIISLTEIYDFLKAKGAEVKNEYLLIHNIPLQFLIPYNKLVEEGVVNFVKASYDGEQINILPLEYLMAIMVQTSRAKDKARLEEMLINGITFDQNKLTEILKAHDLLNQWNTLTRGIQQ